MKKFGFFETVVMDFDGVIHSYKSGWHEGQKITDIYDEPVQGIKETIINLRREGFKIVVVSSRCRTLFGRMAIRKWLKKYQIVVDAVQRDKPPARCYVDDRAICFCNDCKTLVHNIHNFQSWLGV